jgi:signal transduction histidine kinase
VAVPRRILIDVGATLAVGAANAIMIHEASEPGSRAVDEQAYLLGVLMTLPVLLHRLRPIAALLLCSLGLFTYYASTYPGISPIAVLAVPLYSAVKAGHLRWACGVIGGFFAIGFGVVVGRKGMSLVEGVSTFFIHWALAVAVILLAEVARSRQALAAESRERLRLIAEEGRLEAARRVAEDRVRIARELHDTVAHSMATITVQARAALHVVGEQSEAVPALEAIRDTGSRALREMGATLGVLRAGGAEDEERDPAGLARLPALVDAVRAAGVPVELELTGSHEGLADRVDHAAYRILQESLTNVLRHGGPEVRARIRLACGPEGVDLEVADDGAGGELNGGHGLRGMRERAEALGGTFAAGPRDGGGFVVSARLPAVSR